MAVWTYGVDDQGAPQLLGPFESDDEAESAGEELNGVRLVNAPTRQAAIVQLQRGASPSRRRAEPVDDGGEAATAAEDARMDAEALRDG